MYYECVCLYLYFSYPFYKKNLLWLVLYYLLLLAQLYHIFLIRGKIFSKKCNEHKVYVLIFSGSFV